MPDAQRFAPSTGTVPPDAATNRDATTANTANTSSRAPLTIGDIGWTREDAVRARAQLASFAEDWDDPEMNVYDDI